MKYFLTFDQLGSDTCYHEFYKGEYDGGACWKQDSIYVHDDFETANIIYHLIGLVIKDCDPYDYTVINKTQWEIIYNTALSKDEDIASIFKELNKWAIETFEEYDVFTLIGL